MAEGSTENQRTRNNAVVALLVCIIFACVAGIVALCIMLVNASNTLPQITTIENEESVVPSTEECNINFAALQQENADVTAWLYAPGLGLNCAVVQTQGSEDFYQTHNAAGAKSADGAVYLDKYNQPNLSDAVTVLYGGEAGVFKALRNYEDATFFKENSTFTLFQQGRMLTYTVVSAFNATDQSTLERYNWFATYEDLQNFEEDVLNPQSLGSNVAKCNLDETSKFVLLSANPETQNLAGGHYLVCGVLTNDAAI